MTTTEWHNAPEFAEVAEALHVKTTQILAVHNPYGDPTLVLFSPHEDDDERIYSARLRRDADGVFIVSGAPIEHVGFMDELKTRMDCDLPAITAAAISDARL